MKSKSSSFQHAVESYAALNVDVELALATLQSTPVSIHCWQGDDVGGFETSGAAIDGGGLKATGNYPGKPRNMAEFRSDFEKALELIPGSHRINLHACYADLGDRAVQRDEYSFAQFSSWVHWAKSLGLGVDFNPSFFSHPLAADGFTLSAADSAIRKFWIDHGKACRHIASEIGKTTGTPCVNNFWIPDGFKDTPADRLAPRQRLLQSLDEIFEEPLPNTIDAVESKLFGIGSESYVTGSHEFYLGYAISRQKAVCLDAGHFHPTENLADKISSVLLFVPEILLHVSRGIRWDSDHVVILDDATKSVAEEIVRGNFLSRTHIGLDFFDASINRVAAWIIGTRSMQKALLLALLQPHTHLRELEASGDFTSRLALLEDLRFLPFGAVWGEFCERNNTPGDFRWLEEIKRHEREVLSCRG